MIKGRRIRTVLHHAIHRLEKADKADNLQKESSFFYPPPDGGWGWVVVLAACTHSLLVSGFHNAFGVYMISLLETFQSSRSRTAWIGSVSYGFIMIFGPISGKLLQKYGAIKVAIFGALVVMLGVVCSSYAGDIRVLFLTHGILVGVGSSFASTPGLIMVSLYFTTKRSFATGIVMAGGAAGTLVQNQVHRYLINAFGWRTSLRVYCGILTICIFAGFAYRPLEKRRHPSVVENFQTSPLRGFIVDLSLWKDSIFELWVCALGLAKFGFFIPFVHMMKLAGDLGISLDDASYIMVGIGMSSLLSCLLFGKICDLENINRLYVNQASVLFVDLMGAEKMPVAWGFMMAVHTISCFGPPFADTQKQSYLETIMFNFMNITCIYEPALESLKTPKTMIWRRVRREGFIGIFRHLCINKLYVFVCS
ncbi:monocarboxylate transporter 10-like isoform X2 [Dermochelys coriacea]|uniref:monocarboxylate transporter 10-like isoform X2 n=1 Tax=Dermochelys coriacea TaxID=27794 RepID=UPI0018E834FA|nr:monocarboxylate transporter 10-like isoform X2 [Dermochelys coriacea]